MRAKLWEPPPPSLVIFSYVRYGKIPEEWDHKNGWKEAAHVYIKVVARGRP